MSNYKDRSIKIKVFCFSRVEVMEEEVNKFLSENQTQGTYFRLIDIKYQSGDGFDSALIIYKN